MTTENPTKKEICSHFTLTSLSFSLEARGLATFLFHAALLYFFCCLGSGICPFDFCYSALDHGHPYKTPRLIVQSRFSPRLRLLSQKKSRIGQSFPRRVDCIYSVDHLAFFELSSSLRACSPSSASTIKRTLARSCSSWPLGERFRSKTQLECLSHVFN